MMGSHTSDRAKEPVPTYSVCIPNYNMADTLEPALTSVLGQLDDCYEVIVVDDGSEDASLDKLRDLSLRYPILRVVPLARDRRRKLGQTRNITVEEARGDYVILHVDADDVWEPFIPDFVQVFHRLEACLERDILVSGQQINMGRRAFLKKYGPYRNLARAQDIDLWWRLAADDAYVPLDHCLFRTRLQRSVKKTFWKEIADTWHRMSFDIRVHDTPSLYIKNCFRNVLNRTEAFSHKQRFLRAMIILPVFARQLFAAKLSMPDSLPTFAAFKQYRDSKRGTCAELLSKNGCDASLDFLRPEAREIFDRAEQYSQNDNIHQQNQ